MYCAVLVVLLLVSSLDQCLLLVNANQTWIWQGALMPNSIRFAVKTDQIAEGDEFRLVAAVEGKSNLTFARLLPKTALSYADEDFKKGLEVDVGFNQSTRNFIRSFQLLLEGLEPDTPYVWSAGPGIDGRFRTPPKIGTPFNFTFAFGSCADNDSNHVVFSLIPENQRPLFFVHMGDLHYGNLHEDDFYQYSRMYDRTLTRPNQAVMFRNLPTVYMWDDHDYGPNSEDESLNRMIPCFLEN